MERLQALLFDAAGDIKDPSALSRGQEECLRMTDERIHREAEETEAALLEKEKWFSEVEQAIDNVMQETFGVAASSGTGAVAGRPEGGEDEG